MKMREKDFRELMEYHASKLKVTLPLDYMDYFTSRGLVASGSVRVSGDKLVDWIDTYFQKLREV